MVMIEKMKFLSITGPKADIDRMTETYLSKYEIHLENALSELTEVANLSPFLEINPYKEALSTIDSFYEQLEDPSQISPEPMDIENLRHHYAKTCAIWAENFEEKTPAIKQLTDEKRYRIWRVYLAGCAYAFALDRIAIFQVVCIKSGRTSPLLPMSRNYMYEKKD